MSTNFHPKFEEGSFYHVYNRTNNKELLFRNDENFNFFLNKYDYFLKDHLDLVAFCLMPTHFHFLVKVKNDIPISARRHNISDFTLGNVMSESLLVEEQFRKYFISYSKSYNKF
jgi:REP element-mobilizing transposase RayT